MEIELYHPLIDYDIAREISHRALGDTIRRMLQEGWVPHGSLVITQSSPGNLLFYQPMVKLRWS